MATPAILAVAIGNALLLVFLLGGLYVDLLYALPGMPEAAGLDPESRRQLASDGMASIRPLGPGVEILREAQLPGGEPAFNRREVDHMEDVRQVVAGFAWAWLIGGLVLCLGWLAARRSRRAGLARQALRSAALAAVALIAIAGALLLVAFEPVFEAFHAIFFAGDSWRFAVDDTLLQLYPQLFWAASGALVAALVIAQLLAVLFLLRRS